MNSPLRLDFDVDEKVRVDCIGGNSSRGVYPGRSMGGQPLEPTRVEMNTPRDRGLELESAILNLFYVAPISRLMYS